MGEVKSSEITQERFDVSFRDGGLRGLPMRFWQSIVAEGGACLATADRVRSRGVDVCALEGASLLILDRRVVIIT